MGVEIERKFLVVGDAWRGAAQHSQHLLQGYLIGANLIGADRVSNDPVASRCSVRVRVAASAAWLTIKSATRGIERLEYEYPIPIEDGRRMLVELCTGGVEKRRWYVPFSGHTFEVDEFFGDNTGLVVAELELSQSDERFERPSWLGREVSQQPRYYNVNLIRHAYSRWSASERAGE